MSAGTGGQLANPLLRLVAYILDFVLYIILVRALLSVVQLSDGSIIWGYFLFTVGCWSSFSTTPGKRVLGMRIVDADTGKPVSVFQALGRMLGYFVSSLIFYLGFIWILIDGRNQGWHDKIAGTLVVKIGSGSGPGQPRPRPRKTAIRPPPESVQTPQGHGETQSDLDKPIDFK